MRGSPPEYVYFMYLLNIPTSSNFSSTFEPFLLTSSLILPGSPFLPRIDLLLLIYGLSHFSTPEKSLTTNQTCSSGALIFIFFSTFKVLASLKQLDMKKK